MEAVSETHEVDRTSWVIFLISPHNLHIQKSSLSTHRIPDSEPMHDVVRQAWYGLLELETEEFRIICGPVEKRLLFTFILKRLLMRNDPVTGAEKSGTNVHL